MALVAVAPAWKRPPSPVTWENPAMRTRTKICGLKEVEHVQACVRAGADAIGLNFYPPSVRSVSVPTAQRLRAHIPAFVTCVALFVNPTPDEVRSVLTHVAPDLLQFHGSETPEFCAQFGRPYLKAVAVDGSLVLLDFASQYANAAAILVDTPSAGHGGSGRVFDWSLLTKSELAVPLVLSGGLNAENVREAISRVRPYAVDVSSGVESQKGVKDSCKIEAFLQAVRVADADVR
jgi:phosphoribosylanthranilate isomerase